MKRTIRLIIFALALFQQACDSPKPGIVNRPITFDPEREELSLAYMREHYGIIQTTPTIDPRMIVVHWTEVPTLEGSFMTFKPSRLKGRPDIKEAGSLNVSAHYLVDRDGTVYRLMPDTLMARHVIGLNHCSIGIENVGGTEDTPLTAAQLRSNVRLIRYLIRKYEIEFLIGHYEYTRFEGHPLWMESDSGYRTEKVDPGEEFMKEIRKRVQLKNQ